MHIKLPEKWVAAGIRIALAGGCLLLLFLILHIFDLSQPDDFGVCQESGQVSAAEPVKEDQAGSGDLEPFDPPGSEEGQEDKADNPQGQQGPERKSSTRPAQKQGEAGTDPLPSTEPEPLPWEPPTVVIVSDTHYFSSKLTDYGEAFWKMTYRDDGKVIQYSDSILRAFLEEVQQIRPQALVISGDLTLYGEKLNHEELAQILRPVQKSGIPVLVIPGNHDINHPWAVSYFGDQTEPVETVDQAGFYEIYHEFGYDQAVSRDETSLSYLYQLDEKNALLMLDSCQYDPVNLVGGRIQEETLLWIREQLEYSMDQGWKITAVAHHNLLDQSRLYTFDCTIENNQPLVRLLEEYGVDDYFSGHLHAQRSKKHRTEPGVSQDAYGIKEVVTTSLMIPPCQYGVISWDEENQLNYEIRRTDVDSWAKKYEYHNDDLLDFSQFSIEFTDEVISKQVAPTIKNLPQEMVQEMALYYAQIIRRYCSGESLEEEPVNSDRIFQSWKRNQSENRNFKSIESMLKD